jgi:hypothetical protein
MVPVEALVGRSSDRLLSTNSIFTFLSVHLTVKAVSALNLPVTLPTVTFPMNLKKAFLFGVEFSR